MIFNQTEHLAKMANDLYIKWPMVFNQVEHWIKMANDP